jgi:hypothetical protein
VRSNSAISARSTYPPLLVTIGITANVSRLERIYSSNLTSKLNRLSPYNINPASLLLIAECNHVCKSVRSNPYRANMTGFGLTVNMGFD